ncbi:hypothetical protein ACIBI9_34350 [Nonomuraea sp. NPDC050451]|uniref:hypothetical protein n=1 Tax=Nonomuraea sp. NPDC050451 TaxID=3364364 RepID=UPI0037AC6632
MLAISLGVAWLVLGPLCLWLLVRGSTGERLAAIVTLALLEGGTIAMGAEERPPPAPQAIVANVMPSCQERVPVPRSAKVAHEIVLTWAAAPQECGAAEVVVRAEGRKLRLWLYEGPNVGRHMAALTTHHQRVFTLPVHVEGGRAALRLPLREKPDYVLTDGRTGRRIPQT